MKRNKNLYKVNIMQNSLTDNGLEIVLSRSVEVAGIDVCQAIRKAKYNLTKKGDPIREFEFIDEVTRLGTIEVR